MKNITVKQESLSNWREEFDIDEAKVDDKHSPEGKERERNKRKYGNWPVGQHSQTSVRRGIHWANRGDKKRRGAKVEEHVSDWRSDLGENLGINMPTVRPGQLTSTGGRGKAVDLPNPDPKQFKSTGGRGKAVDLPKVKSGQFKEEIQGGINVEPYTKDTKFLEVETVDIIKPEPIKGASNWKLEMVTEMLIAEGYNDEEIVTILSEELPKIPLGPIVTGAFRGAWNLSTKGVRNAYNLGKGARKNFELTKDILSTAKKLRQPKLPKGVEVVKKGAEKGGGLVKSFKGFMQNVKDAGSNLVNRTKGKLTRTDIKTNTPVKPSKVDVLGGAATNPTTTVKPMKNITPSSIGDKITNVTDKVKIAGAGTAGATLGAASTKIPSGTTGTTGTELKGDKPLSASIRGEIKKDQPPVEKKVEAPITNDGKKEVNPSKNEKITTSQKKSGGRPFDADRGKTVDRVYGAQIAQTRKLKGDAAADKQRKKFMSRPVTSLEMDEGMDNMGGPAALGAVLTTTVGLGKAAYDGIKNLKNTLQDKQNEKKKKIKNLTQSYSWRDELNLQEMGAYRGGGTIIDPSGSRNKFGYPDSLKPGSGPTKEVPLTPSQNRMLVKKKTKITTVG